MVGELRVLVLEHRLETLATHVAWCGAIQAVAHGHVIGGDGFRDAGRGMADGEEPPRHFLTAADLGEDAVRRRIEIERERFLGRAEGRGFHIRYGFRRQQGRGRC